MMSLAEFVVGFECHIASVKHVAVNCVVRLLDSSEIINHMPLVVRK